ncbi:MAG: hypothetical protein ACRD0S_13850, partial [Acidimicrobiales bacterium]
AERHFEDAIAQAAGQQAPGWVATAEYCYGRAWLARGDAESAEKGRELLARAVPGADTVGWAAVVDGATALVSAPG